jgi:hypothetical protein
MKVVGTTTPRSFMLVVLLRIRLSHHCGGERPTMPHSIALAPQMPPLPPFACAVLQEHLSTTRVTNDAGNQYDVVFQYTNTAFTVTASSKGGRLPFDPRQIDLPSIPVLVAF